MIYYEEGIFIIGIGYDGYYVEYNNVYPHLVFYNY